MILNILRISIFMLLAAYTPTCLGSELNPFAPPTPPQPEPENLDCIKATRNDFSEHALMRKIHRNVYRYQKLLTGIQSNPKFRDAKNIQRSYRIFDQESDRFVDIDIQTIVVNSASTREHTLGLELIEMRNLSQDFVDYLDNVRDSIDRKNQGKTDLDTKPSKSLDPLPSSIGEDLTFGIGIVNMMGFFLTSFTTDGPTVPFSLLATSITSLAISGLLWKGKFLEFRATLQSLSFQYFHELQQSRPEMGSTLTFIVASESDGAVLHDYFSNLVSTP